MDEKRVQSLKMKEQSFRQTQQERGEEKQKRLRHARF